LPSKDPTSNKRSTKSLTKSKLKSVQKSSDITALDLAYLVIGWNAARFKYDAETRGNFISAQTVIEYEETKRKLNEALAKILETARNS